jgi:Pyruvate/2-oxoacid:ferredoxin oxidoreductase delta subunit
MSTSLSIFELSSDPNLAEKPQKRSEYDETVNKLKTLYVQQKVIQEEIKSTSGKGKKRIADNTSRRSPRKKARSCVSTTLCVCFCPQCLRLQAVAETSDSRAMVDLDAYEVS